MTDDAFARSLPPITDNPLPLTPPFEFSGLSARIFPLRANLDALQRLCNGLLNFLPPEVGRFRAVVPYVYLSVLDYGEIAELLTNLGWFAQVEVFFAVPVEWYQVRDGKWHFHDWAVITPFIYVDDDLSVPLGRTVYGFPKTMAKATAAKGDWLRNPVAHVTLAHVETAVFPELYAGKRLEPRVFLEIERQAPMANLQVPPDAGSPMMPWVVALNVAQAMAGFGRDAMWLAQALRIFPMGAASDPAIASEMAERMAPGLAPGGRGFVLNSLNLKQFRRSDAPALAAYQSLTNGRMQMTAFNGGGLLGEERTLLGDLSGGHTVKLYEYASLPIARTLGLEVHQRWRGDGVDVASFKPVLPFWMNVNVTYEQGINVVWRGHDGVWRRGNGTTLLPAEAPAAPPAFNSIVGSAVDAVAGPFKFTDTTVRVLPLLARRKTLQAYLDRCLNAALDPPVAAGVEQPARVRLSLWCREAVNVNESGVEIGGEFAYVYMTASSFGGVTSKTNNVGDWAEYELAFLIPVKWERFENGAWTLQGVGAVPAYTFVDDTTAAVARSEITGIPTSKATFVRPESSWMNQDDASFESRQTLLRVAAEVIPALGVGQQAAMQTILEITVRDPRTGGDGMDSPDAREQWAEILRAELGAKHSTKTQFPNMCKVARALAIELLGNRVPFALYSLKQFRDVADPGHACYQALVRVSRVMADELDIRELEETVRVRLHDFPTLPIVESLGLVARTVGEEAAGIIYETQAIRPFYVRTSVEEPLAERVMSRCGTLGWEMDAHAFDTVLSDRGAGRPSIAVDGICEHLQDLGDPNRLGVIARAARERRVENEMGGGTQPISPEDARAALSRVDPQMIIESILSREWGNCSPESRWRQGHALVLAASRRMDAGMAAPDFPALQAAAFAAVEAAVEERPGAPDVRPMVDEMIRQMRHFSEAMVELHRHMSVVAAWSLTRSFGERIAPEFAIRAPDPESVRTAIAGLVRTIATFPDRVVGEPSPHNNIAPEALGCFFRLHELRTGPITGVDAALRDSGSSTAEGVEQAWAYIDPLREAAELAARCAEVQREALVNKIAKAYQKPDFCIRRDSVGGDQDRLLPLTLSWDEDWYAGDQIRLQRRTPGAALGGDVAALPSTR